MNAKSTKSAKKKKKTKHYMRIEVLSHIQSQSLVFASANTPTFI